MFQIFIDLLLQRESKKEIVPLSKYYFDGAGKALRPVIALCSAHAYNIHTGTTDPEGNFLGILEELD